MAEKPLFKQLMETSSIGIYLVLSTFAGLALGYFLDSFFKTSPWLTIIFLILGIIAGFRELIRVARKQDGVDKENN